MNIFYLNENVIICAKEHCDAHVRRMLVEYAQMLSTAHRILDGTKIIILHTINCVYKLTDENKLSSLPKGRKQTIYKLSDPKFEETLYKTTHINHPSTKWVRSSIENYMWLYSLFVELGKEYKNRFKKEHLSIIKLKDILATPPKNLKTLGFKEPPQCMPIEYQEKETINAYKEFYKKSKTRFATYRYSEPPDWLKDYLIK